MRHSRSFGSHADVCHPSACRAHRRCVRSTSAKSSGVHSLNGLSSRALFAIQIGGRGLGAGFGPVVPPEQRYCFVSNAAFPSVPPVLLRGTPPDRRVDGACPLAPQRLPLTL